MPRIAISFPRIRGSTALILFISTLTAGAGIVGWAVTGKTYLGLGLNWLGYGSLGIGFFQGKIFWSSIINFALVFAGLYYVLAERQKLHLVPSLLISGSLLVSGAYIFEFAYLFLIQALSKYVLSIGLWVNLLTGLCVGLVLNRMRFNRAAVVCIAGFVVTMAVWYLGGYPQLNNKEILVVPYTNYLGIPGNWSLPLNSVGKGLATLVPLSLLARREVAMPGDDSRVARWGIPLLTFGTVGPLFLVRVTEAAATLFYAYSVCMTGYLLFLYYETRRYKPLPDLGFRPDVTVVVPVKNEEKHVATVVESVLNSDYPKNKLNVTVVDDGSTDKTWEVLYPFKFNPRVTLIRLERNYGKRVALATGFAKSASEILVCIDSDSFVTPDAIKFLVQPFVEQIVVGVAGHGEVANMDTVLAKLQHYWYVEMFRLAKGMESIFGCVSCCSGILAAYRSESVRAVLDEWLNERFLGRKITYGDDRQLTNLVAKGTTSKFSRMEKFHLRSPGDDRTLTTYALSAHEARVVYQSNAVVRTVVPESFRQFLRQQLRWKRAWVHGSMWAAKYMWKKKWPMPLIFYLYQTMTYLSPFVMIYWLIVRPLSLAWVGAIGAFGFLLGNYYVGFLHGLNTKQLAGVSSKGVLYRTAFVTINLFTSMTVVLYGWVTPWKGGWVTRNVQTKPAPEVLAAEVEPQ